MPVNGVCGSDMAGGRMLLRLTGRRARSAAGLPLVVERRERLVRLCALLPTLALALTFDWRHVVQGSAPLGVPSPRLPGPAFVR